MKKMILLPVVAAALLGGCTTYGRGYDRNDGYYANQSGADDWGYYDRSSYDRYGRYDYNTPDPRYNGYYADRYYRNDRRYRERQLNENERIYGGRDGRYYCRRSDGTTGLIVGGIAGGLIGRVIAPGDSKTLGTVLGAIGGAAIGTAADRSVRCR